MEDKKETGPSETVPASSGENPQTTTTTTTVGNMSSPLTRSPPAITPPHPFDSGAKSPTSAPARATVISPLLKSPDSGSKSKPSVKHLECYYFFDDPQGCKWTEERCLYAHHTTGHRAAPPIQIEPGRPPVAGKNATNPHPEYHNWRNSAFEEGVQYSPGQNKSSPRLPSRPGISAPIQRDLDRIVAKAHAPPLQLRPGPHRQPPTPIMGNFRYNVNAPTFSNQYRKYEEQDKPGATIISPAGSPGMAVPLDSPMNPVNPGPHIHDPYYGKPPHPYGPAPYYLAPPPPGPGPQEYEFALQNYQQELEEKHQDLANVNAEKEALRTELANTKSDLQAQKAEEAKLRSIVQKAIDNILILDYHSEAVVLKFRQNCMDGGKDTLAILRELNEFILTLPSGHVRTTLSKARDDLIAANKYFLNGLDNGYGHHAECRRLRLWFREQVENTGDAGAFEQLDKGKAKSGYKWNQFLK